MVIKKIRNTELIRLIEELILEQQNEAMLKGLLASEIKLGLSQKYDIDVDTRKIARLIKGNIAGVKTKTLRTRGIDINIYRIMR